MAISKMFPKSPTDVIFIALSLMQKWSIRLKKKDQDRISKVKDHIAAWMKTFKPSIYLLSDVVEI